MTTTIYQKKFSSIKGIQNEEEVLYGISNNIVSGQNRYGIEISSVCMDKNITEAIHNISDCKEKVMNILTYLYENSVRTETFKDIVSDMYLLKLNDNI